MGGLYWTVNVAVIWGQMATGGGCEKMNEFLGTLGVPGMQGKIFSQTEDKIGAWWKSILSAEVREAAWAGRKTNCRGGKFLLSRGAISYSHLRWRMEKRIPQTQLYSIFRYFDLHPFTY